jgi:hypothetical protein
MDGVGRGVRSEVIEQVAVKKNAQKAPARSRSLCGIFAPLHTARRE